MSLVGTLAKVAIGVAIAKGVSTLAKGAAAPADSGGGMFGGTTQASSGGGLGDLLGGMLGGGVSAGQGGQSGGLGGILDQLSGGQSAQSGQQGGGLGDLLGGMLGGQAGNQQSGNQQSGAQGGGLGDLLGGMLGGQAGAQQGGAQGGLGDLLGSLMGGQTSAQSGAQGQGGLGDLLGGLLGGGAAAGGLGGLMGALTGGAQAAGNDQSLGQVLNSSFSNKGEPDVEPTAHQNAAAAIMLAAMIQAAKSDGKIQQAEKDKLLGNLKDASREEMAFVQAQLDAPVSIETLVAHVPQGMQAQVYTMSLMAIDLDSQAEAQYLNDLAQAMGLSPKQVNGIHAYMGVQALYS